MSNPLDASIDPKHYLRMFWRRRGVILLCAVTLFCAALVGLEFAPQEYDSKSTLMIQERSTFADSIEKVMGDMRAPSRSRRIDEERLDHLSSRVLSAPFLEQVVRLLRLHEDPAAQAEAADALRNDASVSLEDMATRMVAKELEDKISFRADGSGVFEITVSDTDPVQAQLLAAWISELYIDAERQGTLDQLKRAHEFGAEQRKHYEEQLRISEQKLQEYRQTEIETELDNSIVGEDNVDVAEALYSKIVEEAGLARLRVQPFSRQLNNANLVSEKDVLLADPQILNQWRGIVSTLRDNITDRLVGRGPREAGEWPPTGTYVTMRRGLLQLVERQTTASFPDLSSELQNAVSRYVYWTLDQQGQTDAGTYLGQAISDFKRRAQSEPRGEIELARLEDAVDSNRELLASFEEQMIAADINAAMEMTSLGLNIEILNPPQVPLKPSRPDRMRILLAALVLGPLLGAGVAFASEMMDTTLRSMSDFQRVFQGPVLGTTPLLSEITPGHQGVRRYWLPAAVTGVLLVTMLFLLTTRVLRPTPATGDVPTVVESQGR